MSENDFTGKRFDEALARGADLRRRILVQMEMLTVDEFRRRIKETNAECPPGT